MMQLNWGGKIILGLLGMLVGGPIGLGIGLFVGDASQIPAWHAKGISLFVCGSDQAMLRKAATQIAAIKSG